MNVSFSFFKGVDDIPNFIVSFGGGVEMFHRHSEGSQTSEYLTWGLVEGVWLSLVSCGVGEWHCHLLPTCSAIIGYRQQP